MGYDIWYESVSNIADLSHIWIHFSDDFPSHCGKKQYRVTDIIIHAGMYDSDLSERLELEHTVYPKKYAHGFCFAVLCCGYTLTNFPISIRLTSLALWQSNDCPSASKATLMNMDKYFMWIHYERLHNHNKAKHNKTVCIFLGIYCIVAELLLNLLWLIDAIWLHRSGSTLVQVMTCCLMALMLTYPQKRFCGVHPRPISQ